MQAHEWVAITQPVQACSALNCIALVVTQVMHTAHPTRCSQRTRSTSTLREAAAVLASQRGGGRRRRCESEAGLAAVAAGCAAPAGVGWGCQTKRRHRQTWPAAAPWLEHTKLTLSPLPVASPWLYHVCWRLTAGVLAVTVPLLLAPVLWWLQLVAGPRWVT